MNPNVFTSFPNFKLEKRENFICSIYLTGGKHYGNFPKVKSIEHIRKWSESLKSTGISGIMFHNCFTDIEIDTFSDLPVKFVFVNNFKRRGMSGLFRFELYHNLLTQFSSYIENIFFTDSTDLDVLRNPFTHPSYRKDKLYIGCEPIVVSNKYMMTVCRGVRQYQALVASDKNFANRQLMNAGLCGGSYEMIAPFIKRMYEECSRMYPIAFIQDMPLINYLAYTEFRDKVSYGKHVNTVFTAFEEDNRTAWFRHK